MSDWQVKLQLEAMALMVEVEGMKACNQDRLSNGHSIAYDDMAFQGMADAIRNIANQITRQGE